jgi:hypothetical protein
MHFISPECGNEVAYHGGHQLQVVGVYPSSLRTGGDESDWICGVAGKSGGSKGKLFDKHS